MKKIILLISLLILAGCYNPDVTELEPYIPYIAEADLSDLEHAISLEGVEYLESFDNIEASSIQDYINNKQYMALVYGGMEIAEDEAKFMQIVERKLHEFDHWVAILLKNDEMPLVELEKLYKKLMNTDNQISATFLWYGYSVERVDEGIFIEINNDFTTNLHEHRQVGKKWMN